MRILLVFFLIIFNFSLSFSDYYSIKIAGNKLNFGFQPARIYLIEKPKSNANSKTFYLKTNSYFQIKELKNKVNKMISETFVDFSITKIEQPFSKYLKPEFLGKNYIDNIFQINYKSNATSWEICKILQESGNFKYAISEPSYHFEEFSLNDPFYSQQWYLDTLRIKQFLGIAQSDSTIIIGIVDSGVMINHEDLSGSIFENSNEIPNDNIDNDDNGFIDDLNGWDFVGNINYADYINDNLKPDNNVIPDETNTHGTHVAGIAAATSNNKKGIASPGFGSRILPIKVAADNLNTVDRVIKGYEAILYAASMGAKIINCSWLSDFHNPLAQDILDQISTEGAIVIAAAGNNSADNFEYKYLMPANLNGVISVGATDRENQPTNFTDFGWNVDIYAPGIGIYSTVKPNQYDYKSGTSMASPIVAGIAAVLKKNHLEWSTKEVELQLRANSSQILLSDTNFREKFWGIVNPVDAITYNYLQNYSKPGLSVNQIQISDNDIIDKLNTKFKIYIIIKNYLGKAENINYNILPIQNFVKINTIDFRKVALSNGEQDTIKMEITINDSIPFFEGNVYFKIIQSADNFKNLEIIEIPYQLESDSKFNVAQYFDENISYTWLDAASPSKFSFWAIGKENTSNRGVVFSFGKYGTIPSFSKIPTAIYPFNENKAFIAFYQQNQGDFSELTLTENGGFNVQVIDKPLAKINELYFFDALNGILLGSAYNGYYGIRLTNDGGKSWKINPQVQLIQDEEILDATFQKSGLITAFTNGNKVMVSEDFGYNWKVFGTPASSQIKSILGINNDSILIFIFDNIEQKYFSYLTTNNGNSWQKQGYLISNFVMQCFNPDSSNSIYCQCRNGEIISSDDLGKSWRYILTKDYLFKSIDVSANFIDDCGIRLWQIGDDLSFTDFIANYKNEIKVLQIEGNELISFDTLDINKSNEKILFLSNNGNAIVRISGAYLKNTYKESNFQIIKQFPDKIKPCEIYDAKVQFNPTSHGFKEDTLVILYNNALDTLTYELTGFGNDTQISVKSSNTNKILLFPNPAENFLIIRGLKEETKCNIKIYSMLGILEKQYNFQSNSLDYILSLEDISAGLKIVKIRHDDIFEIKKIMISK